MLDRFHKTKTYTFSEFRILIEEGDTYDYNLVEKFLGHVKKNKAMYLRLVFLSAIIINKNMNPVFASTGAGLETTFEELKDLLMMFAKWSCLGLGIKRVVEEMLSGANFKQASTAGIQYWLTYIFIQVYPKLYDRVKF